MTGTKKDIINSILGTRELEKKTNKEIEKIGVALKALAYVKPEEALTEKGKYVEYRAANNVSSRISSAMVAAKDIENRAKKLRKRMYNAFGKGNLMAAEEKVIDVAEGIVRVLSQSRDDAGEMAIQILRRNVAKANELKSKILNDMVKLLGVTEDLEKLEEMIEKTEIKLLRKF